MESNNYLKESEELMRVKLSYTAEMEEVLPEAAYMLKNLGETINNTIKDYNVLLENLGDVEVGKKRCGIARRGGRNKIFSKCRRKFTLTLEHC